MPAETTATYNAMLKEYYTGDVVEDMVYRNNPLLALMPKMTTFEGKSLPVPIIIGTTQGGSANFGTAVANKGASTTRSWQLTRRSDYALASIGREVMMASQSDKGAFMEAAKVNIDGAIKSVTRSLAINMYRRGTGRRGNISAASNVGTNTITLADINTVTNFEIDMVIQLSATDGTGVVRAGTATITAVNRSTGTLTFGAALTSFIAAAAVNDAIFRAGDYALLPTGLDGWIPAEALRPTALGQDLFFGVDRFPDIVRLGGVTHDGTSQSIEEALMDAQSKGAREGALIDHAFINNAQYRQLLKSLSSKVHYVPTNVDANARISFKCIELMGDMGPIKIIADPNCPSTTCYMLQMDTWKFYSLDAAPHIFDQNTDQEMLREAGNDGYELRTGYYGNMACRAPGWNVRCELAPAI